jgi:hypothetical protein
MIRHPAVLAEAVSPPTAISEPENKRSYRYGSGQPAGTLAKRLITRITRFENPVTQGVCVASIIGASAMQSVLLQKSYSLNEFARQNAIGFTAVRGEIKAGRLAARKVHD